jgi:hypothetical protein
VKPFRKKYGVVFIFINTISKWTKNGHLQPTCEEFLLYNKFDIIIMMYVSSGVKHMILQEEPL